MRIAVIGAAGMVGRKLVERVAADPVLEGDRRVSQMLLVDAVRPASVDAGNVEIETLVADLAEPGVAERVLTSRPAVIFDLAAVVSGEAEADFDKGYRVNLDATRLLFEAVRGVGGGYCPRLVFSSSIAVFGPPVPEVIGDEQRTTPETSYGTQKAIVELLLDDYTRRGFLDGVGDPASHDLRAPGQAEPGRVWLLLEHHSRAAERRGRGTARLNGRPPLVRLAARGGRVSDPCRDAAGGRPGCPEIADDARGLCDGCDADRGAAPIRWRGRGRD